jgi:ABC-type amino acid transport substrate-binding protein
MHINCVRFSSVSNLVLVELLAQCLSSQGRRETCGTVTITPTERSAQEPYSSPIRHVHSALRLPGSDTAARTAFFT